jgi:glucose/arabinose dehydrogenase
MPGRFCRALCSFLLAAVLVGAAAFGQKSALAQGATQAAAPPGESAGAASEPTHAGRRSAYTTGKDVCGSSPMAFPRVRIGMRSGYCAGLVASKEDGLIFPRTIVQVPNTRYFVVADMGGWSAKQGRLLLLDPQAPEGKRIKVLMTKLDVPHGLAVGIDHRIYASTDDTVFRFDPLAAHPEATVEVILQGLPGLQPTLSDGSKLERNSLHPLKPFIFDKTGRIYVNIGAPTDNCGAQATESKPCAAGEGNAPLASVWAFTPPAGGIFPALKPGAANPPREVFARGLRNSMALAVHSKYPDAGFAFLQGENARDLPDIMKPNEEINALEKGRHYGWPYCYDLTTTSPEYKAFLQTRSPYQNLCTGNAIYKQPYSLLPPHAAPLSMFYYQADKFPELKGKLIVGLHGYRPTGGRVIFYDVDATGFPIISPPPVNYNVSCAAEPVRPFQTEGEPRVAAAVFKELITDWHRVNGVRPQGAPVGMTVAADGAIWLVEDKNQTILRIDVATRSGEADVLPCDARTEAQIKELIALSARDQANRTRLAQFRAQVVEKHCMGCHSDFDLKAGMNDAQKDAAVLHFLLSQDGWIYPGDPESGRLHSRVWGKGAEKIMPDDGEALIAKEPGYKQALDAADALVAHMVPGERKRLKLGRGVALPVHNRAGRVCGSIPNNTLVVVLDKSAGDKPGFSRIFRPADQYLNGECADGDGYYVTTSVLAPP